MVALFLTAGILLNIAAAIACTIIAQQWPQPATNLTLSARGVDRLSDLHTKYHDSSARNALFSGYDTNWLGYREFTFISNTLRFIDERPVFEYDFIIEIEAGWPLTSLRRIKRTDMDDRQWLATFRSFLGAPRVASADAEWYIIPTEPVWKGFVLNSLFYAVALAIIFAGPGMVRRHYRSRRGLCLRCAYPIGTSDRCSECGEPIPPNARRLTERAISKT